MTGVINYIVTANHLTDYSYINARDSLGRIAHCITGLGPTGTDNNNALGGWYFNGVRLASVPCLTSTPFVQNGAGNLVGVNNLGQCVPLPTTGEGVYTCTMMNSSLMNQSMRLGIYFTGRSELFDSATLYIITN